uniref:Uncharacterized protein n=1 Tax=Chromera velia CCMP2878 TaxID=1169474 RepID=A0A0K6S811_9ALVE|eukprot:Cvel_23361.t1-p1 / transcript=Cvel_23361.t1 / gene=Cvel_23361 / organism=Chromera_velia_CCMP2878 / gene_product=hypothetical protein / transcript_product=hypothetical protein / location=Cvel_scaffold2398:11860-16162(-) / protein_length=177 / sequence_SO=supercontig / SO=protein_coding / is_pseudo=false
MVICKKKTWTRRPRLSKALQFPIWEPRPRSFPQIEDKFVMTEYSDDPNSFFRQSKPTPRLFISSPLRCRRLIEDAADMGRPVVDTLAETEKRRATNCWSWFVGTSFFLFVTLADVRGSQMPGGTDTASKFPEKADFLRVPMELPESEYGTIEVIDQFILRQIVRQDDQRPDVRETLE